MWPTVTDEDGVPDYKRQTWPAARVLVWRRTEIKNEQDGQRVDLEDPANWLADGKPADSGPDENTDLVFPDCTATYFIINSVGQRFSRSPTCRHITVGAGAVISLAGLQPHGNWWIRKGGYIYERHGGSFTGKFHTFARNDNTPAWRPGTSARPRETTLAAWPLVQENSQYFFITKTGDASVEAVGNWASQDQFHLKAGTLIVGPDSYVGSGARGSVFIEKEGALQLQSGAAFSKRINQSFGLDIIVRGGAVRAGSKARPIRRDATLGLSVKDYIGDMDDLRNYPQRNGLQFQSGVITVTTAERAPNARLVIQWSGMPFDVLLEPNAKLEGDAARQIAAARRLPLTVTASFPPNIMLNRVRFEDFRVGGIQGVAPEQVAKWTNVEFGKRNAGPVGEMIARADWYAPLVGLPSGPIATLGGGSAAPAFLLRTTFPGTQIRYTVDGSEPGPSAKLFDGKPVTLAASATIRAIAVADGRTSGRELRYDALVAGKLMPALKSFGKTPGLLGQAGSWQDRDGRQVLEGKTAGAKPAELVAERVQYIGREHGTGERFGLMLSGFLTVPVDGAYVLKLTADDRPQAWIEIDGIRVLADGDAKSDQRTVWLAKGPHRIVAGYFLFIWGNQDFRLEWQPPGSALAEIPATVYTH